MDDGEMSCGCRAVQDSIVLCPLHGCLPSAALAEHVDELMLMDQAATARYLAEYGIADDGE